MQVGGSTRVLEIENDENNGVMLDIYKLMKLEFIPFLQDIRAKLRAQDPRLRYQVLRYVGRSPTPPVCFLLFFFEKHGGLGACPQF
jgi:hypothetical protein